MSEQFWQGLVNTAGATWLDLENLFSRELVHIVVKLVRALIWQCTQGFSSFPQGCLCFLTAWLMGFKSMYFKKNESHQYFKSWASKWPNVTSPTCYWSRSLSFPKFKKDHRPYCLMGGMSKNLWPSWSTIHCNPRRRNMLKGHIFLHHCSLLSKRSSDSAACSVW